MAMKIRPRALFILITFSIGVFASHTAFSAESGSALYIGGSQAFGAGGTPPPGTYGTIAAVVDGGVVDINVRKTAFAFVANIIHVLPGGIADGRLGFSASLPFASMTDPEVSAAGAVTGNVQTDGWGIGDLGSSATQFAGGAGFRYMIDPESGVSIGVDLASAGDGIEFYVQISDFIAN
jgi:hypothetical protein